MTSTNFHYAPWKDVTGEKIIVKSLKPELRSSSNLKAILSHFC